jgi:molecular chaperone GrpE (heat shock protein)
MEEGDGDQEIVSEELQAGFKIGDDVIRHAMVRVNKQ